MRIALTLGVGTVKALVVGKRMRVRADYMRVDKCRTVSGTAIAYRPDEGRIACNRIGSVNLFEMEIREAGHQPRNIAAGSLHFDRYGNGVSVVLDHEISGATASSRRC